MIQTGYWTVALVLAGLFFAATAYVALIGVVAVFTGARYEACPTCHRHCLTRSGEPHADGCPHSTLADAYHHLFARPWHPHLRPR